MGAGFGQGGVGGGELESCPMILSFSNFGCELPHIFAVM